MFSDKKRVLFLILCCLGIGIAVGVVLTKNELSSAKNAPKIAQDLYLSSVPPDRNLALNAEILLVSGYEPSQKNITVNVSRPNSNVILVLTSYHAIDWQVTASESTKIVAIIVSSNDGELSTVFTAALAQGYRAKLSYATETENANFDRILSNFNDWFGVAKIDFFQGAYRIPTVVNIFALDPPHVNLSLAGVLPVKPSQNFSFNIVSANFKQSTWSLTGPSQNTQDAQRFYSEAGNFVLSKSGKEGYEVNNSDELIVTNLDTGQKTKIALPANYPEFSWVMGLAYDSKRNIVTIVSLGGDGYFYRLDATTKQWIDYYSLDNVDIFSFAYDEVTDRYVAFDQSGSLFFISGEGNILFKKEVISKLAGFNRLYDKGNERPPRLTLVPNGNDIALISMGSEALRIWLYNEESDTASLTYRK